MVCGFWFICSWEIGWVLRNEEQCSLCMRNHICVNHSFKLSCVYIWLSCFMRKGMCWKLFVWLLLLPASHYSSSRFNIYCWHYWNSCSKQHKKGETKKFALTVTQKICMIKFQKAVAKKIGGVFYTHLHS